MSVITVLGEIDHEELGVVLPHEHIFLDLRKRLLKDHIYEVSQNTLFHQKVEIENLGDLKNNVLSILDNLLLSDIDLAIEELKEFRNYGGNTIVDQSNEFMGRDPVALAKISRATGLNIITCTGQYVDYSHPAYVEDSTKDYLANLMIKELEQGIGDTGVRAGIIGELGVSREYITDNEKKVLQASVIAQQAAGVPIFVHTPPWATAGIEVLNILEQEGANLQNVVICHIDGKINYDYCKGILQRGAYIEFDSFGKDYKQIYKGEQDTYAIDEDRVKVILKLISGNDDFLHKILISTDVWAKIDLKKFGGYGYAHILKNIIPLLMKKKYGFTNEQIDCLIKDNPQAVLTIKK